MLNQHWFNIDLGDMLNQHHFKLECLLVIYNLTTRAIVTKLINTESYEPCTFKKNLYNPVFMDPVDGRLILTGVTMCKGVFKFFSSS